MMKYTASRVYWWNPDMYYQKFNFRAYNIEEVFRSVVH